MPFALILAVVASLGIHATLLFGPDFDLATEPETVPLLAELRPLQRPPADAETAPAAARPPTVKPKTAQRRRTSGAPKSASETPVLSVPGTSAALASEPELSPEAIALSPTAPLVATAPTLTAAAQPAPPAEPRLPRRMRIRYRVDRGDSNFEIGFAEHDWQIEDGRYRLHSVVETTGIVWLFKSLRVEMDSRGTLTAAGLRPESFAVVRDGHPTRENAAFDWERMTVRVGGRAEQAVAPGAQDLLSFNYQLGFLPDLHSGSTLPIVTGKKYGIYRLQVLGDEQIELPAGSLRTLHLRAPGENTTELWLAYDYLLLPVKIRYLDAKGDSFVQVATQIQLSQ